MNSAGIEKVLRDLGVRNTKTTATKVRCSCPLALWRHSSGSDSSPSFAVWIKEDAPSAVRCLSCGYKAGLMDLVMAVQARAHQDLSPLLLFIAKHDAQKGEAWEDNLRQRSGLYSLPRISPAQGSGFNSSVWNRPGAPDFNDPEVMTKFAPAFSSEHEALVQRMADSLDDEALYYLHEERGFSDEVIKDWRLGWHPQRRRISVPQYDCHGRLVNVGGRYVPSVFDSWKPPKWFHSGKTDLYLFGEDRFTRTGKGTAFVVEGQFDVVALAGMKKLPNVAGMNGSDMSRTKAEKLVRWFDRIVIVPDGDKAGYDAAEKWCSILGNRVQTHVFETPMGLDPDQLPDELIEELRHRFLV